MKVGKLTRLALLTAAALSLFLVEAQIPLPIPIPGVKLGLSNIVTVCAVYLIGAREGAMILFVRIILGALFSGNFATVFYSAAGGLLAILTTIGLKYVLQDSQLWICGCLSAIAHSIGQMIMAVLLTGTPSLLIYLPVLILCSIFTGMFTGLCAQVLIKRGKNLWKTIFK